MLIEGRKYDLFVRSSIGWIGRLVIEAILKLSRFLSVKHVLYKRKTCKPAQL